jgi:D-glycero-D-manno-heptose 1,7-bisphosphate phosphatase
VIIENLADYVRSWTDVHIYPQALDALRRAAASNFKVILITNQSAVGRGLITLQTAQTINRRLVEAIHQSGGRIDAVYMCPHAPEVQCACRKPQPGLIFYAALDHDLDLPNSILIGDAISDIQAGLAAGVGRLAIVLTGRGAEQIRLNNLDAPVHQYLDLATAIANLL